MFQFLFNRSDKSLKMSAPRTYELHGVTIRKLPVGKYIQVLQALGDTPQILLGEAFPECKSLGELLAALGGLNEGAATAVFSRLLTAVPEQVCRLLSSLLDIPKDRLLDPDTPDPLGLNDLAEILEAFIKENDMADFFATARRLMGAGKASGGSSAGLQSGKA